MTKPNKPVFIRAELGNTESKKRDLEAMSHDVSGMPLVKNPSKRLGEIISRIDSSRDVKQLNVTPSFPILDSKEPNIDMP